MWEKTETWRTLFRPLPDITAYELAIDKQHINSSHIVGSWEAEQMGSVLRHRLLDEGRRSHRRMDEVYREWKKGQEDAGRN
jgi:hypothetical protein